MGSKVAGLSTRVDFPDPEYPIYKKFHVIPLKFNLLHGIIYFSLDYQGLAARRALSRLAFV